jgi:hypothetical protein
MLNQADIGVQLYHKDVPIVFGDVMISNLKVLEKVMFCDSKLHIEDMILVILLSSFNYVSLNLI